MKKLICNICGCTFSGYGNNPYPLCDINDFESRCCDECNSQYVIPSRIYELGGVRLTDEQKENIIKKAKGEIK